jgi:hypothetical protein
MAPSDVALICVAGPVEPTLLTEFVEHYRGLGVQEFRLAFHFPDETAHDREHLLLELTRRLGVEPGIVSRGPWHEDVNARLRDRLRQQTTAAWHLLTDVDEFQQYPGSLADVLELAAARDARTVTGLLLDRVSADGSLPDVSRGLDATFPLGGFLTHSRLHGDPRKVALARPGAVVADGNHRSPGYRSPVPLVVAVHHFKWRAGVVEYLRQRQSNFETGRWRETTPAMRAEAGLFLDWLDRHDGRIDVRGVTPWFRPVTLDTVAPWWQEAAAELIATWRPWHPSNDDDHHHHHHHHDHHGYHGYHEMGGENADA